MCLHACLYVLLLDGYVCRLSFTYSHHPSSLQAVRTWLRPIEKMPHFEYIFLIFVFSIWTARCSSDRLEISSSPHFYENGFGVLFPREVPTGLSQSGVKK